MRNNKILKVGILFLLMTIVLEGLIYLIPSTILVKFDQYLSILLPVLILALIFKIDFKERFKLKGIKLSTVFFLVLITLFMLPISGFVGELTTLVFGQNKFGINAYLESLDVSPFMIYFLIAVTPAICEELMHRGLLLDLKAPVSMHHLAILSGIMFGLFHIGYDQVFYTAVMGYIIAYSVIITGSILPGIIIHLLNNSLSAMSLIFASGSSEVVETTTESVSILSMLPFAAFGALMIYFIYKKLIKDYNYDDKKRIEENLKESTKLQRSDSLTMYFPIILVALYVLLVNLLLHYVGL